MAILSTEEMIRFKNYYKEELKKGSVKVALPQEHIDRHDVWAFDVLGNAEFAFMYPILIHNEEDANENGYFVAGSDGS